MKLLPERIESIFTEVWVCGRCGRWAYRALAIEQGDCGGKGWNCEYCGCSSVRLRGPGRPLSKCCAVWEREAAWFCELALDLPLREVLRYARLREAAKELKR